MSRHLNIVDLERESVCTHKSYQLHTINVY